MTRAFLSFPMVAGLLGLLGLLGATAPAWADRPFVATTSAAAEEDDDRVWSVATWAQRDKRLGEYGLSAEYALEPRLSTEFTLARSRPRLSGAEATLEAEAEVKGSSTRSRAMAGASA